jgi:general secretion pathway protein A
VLLPPVVTIPGHRPLLELFPSESHAADTAGPPQGHAPLAFPPAAPKRSAPDRQARPSAGAATYETFYGLREPPFSLSTDPKFLYQSAAYDAVAQDMLAAIGRREPLVLLTGDTGAGKTTMCRSLLEQLDRHTLTSVVSEPFATLADLLKTLLVDFGVVSRDEIARGRMASATEGELVSALNEFLQSLAPLQAFAVVIIDDAQAIQPAVLNDLERLITAEGTMQIVLVGQPALAAALDAGKRRAPALAKAVTVRCELGLLADDEVGGYVMNRLRVAGTHPRVQFDDAAFSRLFAISGGNPRLLNLLCDRALARGFENQASEIDEATVETAAEELDMAPPLPKNGIFGNLSNIAMLVLLMLAGAAAGALAFHSDLEAILRGR